MAWAVPIAAAGVSALGAYMGARSQNRANRIEAEKQRDFQERMSSTSYQRGMEDMQLAGLNPILAYQQGGASAPPGAKAQMENEIGAAANAALEARRTIAEIQNMRSQNKKLEAEADLARASVPKAQTMSELWQVPLDAVEEAKRVLGLSNSAKRSRVSLQDMRDLGVIPKKVKKVKKEKFPWSR